jgi:mRNA interferase RelE/StbE
MVYKIETPKDFEKLLKKIPHNDLIKIRDRIRSLVENPRPNGIEKLDDNLYRIRQGNYRILYKIYDEKLIILIVTVDHRRQVYRNL